MMECFPKDATLADFHRTMATLLNAAIPEGEEIPEMLSLLAVIVEIRTEGSGATLH